MAINNDRDSSKRANFMSARNDCIYGNSLELELNGENFINEEDLEDDFEVFQVATTENQTNTDTV